MTDIVKLVVDGEEHWTAEGSQRHVELLERQRPDIEQHGGQREEGDDAKQQNPEVPGSGGDHNAEQAGGGSGDGQGDDAGPASGQRRARPSQSAPGR